MDTGHLRKARNPSPGMGPDQGQLTGKNPRRSARRDHRSPPPSSPWGLRFPRASEENSPRQQTTRQREGPVFTSVPVRLVHVNTRPAHASTGRHPARPTSARLQGTAPRAAVLPATRPKATFHQSGRKSVGKCSSLPTFQWGDSEVPSTQLRAGTPGGGSPRSPSAHLCQRPSLPCLAVPTVTLGPAGSAPGPPRRVAWWPPKACPPGTRGRDLIRIKYSSGSGSREEVALDEDGSYSHCRVPHCVPRHLLLQPPACPPPAPLSLRRGLLSPPSRRHALRQGDRCETALPLT